MVHYHYHIDTNSAIIVTIAFEVVVNILKLNKGYMFTKVRIDRLTFKSFLILNIKDASSSFAAQKKIAKKSFKRNSV